MHPILLTIGRFELPAYGVLAALGILAGTGVAMVLGRRNGLGADFVIDVVFWTVLGGFAGARLAYMALHWREALRDPSSALLSGGGGIFVVGGIVGALAAWIVCRRHGVSFPVCADVLVPGAALAHVFGRVGCFLSGCCYGRPAGGMFAWAGVRFPKLVNDDGRLVGSWPYFDHLKGGMVRQADPFSLPVYPVQLIEAGFNLLVFFLLLAVWRRRTANGQVLAAYLILYCTGRFLLEFLRGDADRGIWAGLSLSQWTCVAAALFALWLLRRTPWRSVDETGPS